MVKKIRPPGYGKLIVYAFPKEMRIYGRYQIEARIQQSTEISQQISLWNQMGSRVIRGHLVVVPIEHSILYVSPLYLRGVGTIARTETGDRRLWRSRRDRGKSGRGARGALQGDAAGTGGGAADVRARDALAHYDLAIERLKAGDWAGFGAELDALRPLLEALGAVRANNKQ